MSESSQPVADALKTLIDERTEKGRQTYGEPLQVHNGRDARQDALEESVDLNQYLMQELKRKEEELEQTQATVAHLRENLQAETKAKSEATNKRYAVEAERDNLQQRAEQAEADVERFLQQIEALEQINKGQAIFVSPSEADVAELAKRIREAPTGSIVAIPNAKLARYSTLDELIAEARVNDESSQPWSFIKSHWKSVRRWLEQKKLQHGSDHEQHSR